MEKLEKLIKRYKEFVRDEYRRGERCPWYKGFVYSSYERNSNKVCIIPFNIIFQIIYGVWWRIYVGFRDNTGFNNEQKRIRKHGEYE